MIALCTKCQTLNDFRNDPIDTCYKCGESNITNENFKIYHPERKENPKRKKYIRPKGDCSICGRKNIDLYSAKDELCQNCYRDDVTQRQIKGIARQYRKHSG